MTQIQEEVQDPTTQINSLCDQIQDFSTKVGLTIKFVDDIIPVLNILEKRGINLEIFAVSKLEIADMVLSLISPKSDINSREQ